MIRLYFLVTFLGLYSSLPRELIDGRVRCSVRDPTDEELSKQNRILKAKHNWKHKSPVGRTIGGPIDTFVHVIFDPITEQGFLSNTTVLKQMQVLNDAFADGKWEFVLRGINYVGNESWIGLNGGSLEVEMKTMLRRGTARTLNIYVIPELAGYLGYATLPSDFAHNVLDDSIVLHTETLPGGSYVPVSYVD